MSEVDWAAKNARRLDLIRRSLYGDGDAYSYSDRLELEAMQYELHRHVKELFPDDMEARHEFIVELNRKSEGLRGKGGGR